MVETTTSIGSPAAGWVLPERLKIGGASLPAEELRAVCGASGALEHTVGQSVKGGLLHILGHEASAHHPAPRDWGQSAVLRRPSNATDDATWGWKTKAAGGSSLARGEGGGGPTPGVGGKPYCPPHPAPTPRVPSPPPRPCRPAVRTGSRGWPPAAACAQAQEPCGVGVLCGAAAGRPATCEARPHADRRRWVDRATAPAFMQLMGSACQACRTWCSALLPARPNCQHTYPCSMHLSTRIWHKPLPAVPARCKCDTIAP